MTSVRGDLLTTVHSSPKETLLDPDLLRGLRGTESSDSSGFSESELEISLRLGFWRPLSSTLGALLRGLGTSAGAALFKEEDTPDEELDPALRPGTRPAFISSCR